MLLGLLGALELDQSLDGPTNRAAHRIEQLHGRRSHILTGRDHPLHPTRPTGQGGQEAVLTGISDAQHMHLGLTARHGLDDGAGVEHIPIGDEQDVPLTIEHLDGRGEPLSQLGATPGIGLVEEPLSHLTVLGRGRDHLLMENLHLGIEGHQTELILGVQARQSRCDGLLGLFHTAPTHGAGAVDDEAQTALLVFHGGHCIGGQSHHPARGVLGQLGGILLLLLRNAGLVHEHGGGCFPAPHVQNQVTVGLVLQPSQSHLSGSILQEPGGDPVGGGRNALQVSARLTPNGEGDAVQALGLRLELRQHQIPEDTLRQLDLDTFRGCGPGDLGVVARGEGQGEPEPEVPVPHVHARHDLQDDLDLLSGADLAHGQGDQPVGVDLAQGRQVPGLHTLLVFLAGFGAGFQLRFLLEIIPFDLEPSQGGIPGKHGDVDGLQGLGCVTFALEGVDDLKEGTCRGDPASQVEALHGKGEGVMGSCIHQHSACLCAFQHLKKKATHWDSPGLSVCLLSLRPP